MSEPYQIASLIPDGLPAEEGIRRCHRILGEEGIKTSDDSLLALHDTDIEEPEPEALADEASALQRLISWPTLGSVDYAGTEGIVTVSYFGPQDRALLTCVLISALERAVDRTDSLPRYRRLASRLHAELGARRTIMEWGLEMRGFSWSAEIDRLLSGQSIGEYPLLDLGRG